MTRELLFLTFVLCCIVDAKVIVRFKVLGADAPEMSSSDIATLLSTKYSAKTLNASYPILDLKVAPVNSSTTTSTSTGVVNGSTGTTSSSEENKSAASSLKPFYLIALLGLFVTSSKRMLVILLIGFFLQSSLVEATVYTNCKLLDDTINYKFSWTISNDTLYAKIEAKVTGWIALGVSADGTMNSGGQTPGTDIALGWIDSVSCVDGCLYDYSTTVYSLPIRDTTQNLQLHKATSVNGVLSLEFSRLLTASDTAADRSIDPAGVTHFLWAAHESVSPVDASTFQKHTHRGPVDIMLHMSSQCPGRADDIEANITLDTAFAGFDVNLFVNSLANSLQVDTSRISIIEVIDEEDAFCPNCTILEFRFPTYHVPSQRTTYACAGFSWNFSSKQHIIRFAPIKDNTQVLHHMLLYQLPVGASPISSTPMDNCNMPNGALPIYAWAPGAPDVDTPPEAGFAVGVQNAVLQIHYDNPTNSPSFTDTSGVRMYITNQLRQYDAGLMFFGIDLPDVSIPPGYANYHESGTCSQLATGQLTGSLTVFGTGPHMHVLGRQLWTDHYRKGNYLGTLGAVYNYDFNSQRFYSVNTTIEAGDTLITHCIWDSTSKTSVTLGGEATDNEMCFNMLLYYPKMDIYGCTGGATVGCNCTGKDACSVAECRTFKKACSNYLNCSSCSQDASCGWCESSTLSSCVDSTLKSSCTGVGGFWNTCSNNSGTPCGKNYHDCASCNADTANSCHWCDIDAGSSNSICLGGSFSSTACGAIKGNYMTSC